LARGLTHPTAHIGKPIIDISTKKEYVYNGFIFDRNIRSRIKDYEIIKTINKEQDSGAIFMFSAGNKQYGVVYFSRSVTAASSISAGDLGMQYSGRKGATENLKIQSDKLIKGGKFEIRTLNDQDVRCAVFKKSEDLERSILEALKINPAVGPHIYDAVNDYFRSSNLEKFDWSDSFRESDINELGKYLGELIIGAIVLRNKTAGKFSMDIFSNKGIKEFIVPDDPSFSGVDSAFVARDGSLLPISSKLGAGAKASFFTNFLPKVIDKRALKNSVIKDVADTARSIGVTRDSLNAKKGAKEITYEYGIRKILGIDSNKIRNTYQVFLDAKKNNLTKELLLVMEAIKKNQFIDKKVKDGLPYSITSAFSREIARRLNNDNVSIDIVAEVLAGKNFYQANLDINRWKKGEVYFRLLASGKSKVSFIGSKAAIMDIDAKQGLVNYELKYT
jgi:hypothetical protein